MIPTDAKERAFRFPPCGRRVRSVDPTRHLTVRREGDLGPKQTLGYDSGDEPPLPSLKANGRLRCFRCQPIPSRRVPIRIWAGGRKGVDAGFCWKCGTMRGPALLPTAVQPERSRRPRQAHIPGRALRLRSVRTGFSASSQRRLGSLATIIHAEKGPSLRWGDGVINKKGRPRRRGRPS